MSTRNNLIHPDISFFLIAFDSFSYHERILQLDALVPQYMLFYVNCYLFLLLDWTIPRL